MYDLKEMMLLNMSRRNCVLEEERPVTRIYEIYEIEDKLSVAEKIKFIDEIEDNIASYLLNIFEKWEKENPSLKRDVFGDIKTVSKKAWIKRNDSRCIIDTELDLGSYNLFGTKYETMSRICPRTSRSYKKRYTESMIYTGKNVVHQWFHDLCDKLCDEERKYFEAIDPIAIRIKKIKDYAGWIGTLNNNLINDICYNDKRDVGESVLDFIVNKYEKLEENIKIISEDINEKANLK